VKETGEAAMRIVMRDAACWAKPPGSAEDLEAEVKRAKQKRVARLAMRLLLLLLLLLVRRKEE
jgi:hypothetical protein